MSSSMMVSENSVEISPSALEGINGIHLQNPFCGPGFIAFNLLSSLALLSAWIFHRQHAHSDTLTRLFFISHVVPFLVALHQIYLVYYYPIDRRNMWNWDIPVLYDWNFAIQNNHFLLRSVFLFDLVVLLPMASIRKHEKRSSVMHQLLSVLLFAYTVSEVFKVQEGSRLVILPIANGAQADIWRGMFFFCSFVMCVLFGVQHILLLSRTIYKYWKGEKVGYLAGLDRTIVVRGKPGGWKITWARRLRKCILWDIKASFVLNGFIYPLLGLWLVGRTMVVDYRVAWGSKTAEIGDDVLLRHRLAIWSALFVLFPSTNQTIGDWKQIVALFVGIVILGHTIVDIWESRCTNDLEDDENELEVGTYPKESTAITR